MTTLASVVRARPLGRVPLCGNLIDIVLVSKNLNAASPTLQADADKPLAQIFSAVKSGW